MARSLDADPPQINHMQPGAAIPGQTLNVTVFGQRLDQPTMLWTSFPAKVELAAGVDGNAADSEQVTYRLTVPRQAQVGIGAMRLITRKGASNLKLFMLDDLPSVNGNSCHHSRQKAQPLTLPVAVDAACDALKSDYYRFSAAAGQQISLEVVAQRLASPLDPVVRLLDKDGRELAQSDDEPGVGADCRMRCTIPSAGEYFIEVRDIRHQGGADYRYRLRLGNFPLANVAFPMGGQSGSISTFQVLGPAVDAVMPVSIQMPQVDSRRTMPLAIQFPDGQGSGWVTVVADTLTQVMESEPNDQPEYATHVSLPCVVNGRFERTRDRDFFQLQVQAGQRLIFQGKTRTLNSPSDLLMQLLRADGSVVAETDDAGTGEGQIDHAFSEGGTYLLLVDELTHGGGPEHAYQVEIDWYTPGFSLSIDSEKFDVPEGGSLVANVKAVRRDYNGPITLAVTGAGEDLVLENHVIAQDKSETNLKVTLPRRLAAGSFCPIRVIGRATVNGAEYVASASTMPALRKVLRHNPYPPQSLDGLISLGIVPAFAPFFELTIESRPIYFPTVVGFSRFRVQLKRLDKQFKSPISLAVENLPDGICADVKPVGKGETEYLVTLQGAVSLPIAAHTIRLIGEGTFQNQTKKVVLDNVPLHVCQPLLVDVIPAGPLVQGGTQKTVLRVRRFGDEPTRVHLRWKSGPEGILAPLHLTIPAERNEVEFELMAAQDAPAGRFKNLVVTATTNVKGERVEVDSTPAVLEIKEKTTDNGGSTKDKVRRTKENLRSERER